MIVTAVLLGSHDRTLPSAPEHPGLERPVSDDEQTGGQPEQVVDYDRAALYRGIPLICHLPAIVQ